MTIRCAVKGCNSIYNKGCDKHFFSFPVKNAELLKKWIVSLGQHKDFQPSTASRVCCLHFEASDFIDTPGIKRKILKSNKFPTRNLTHSNVIQNDPLSDLHEMIEYKMHLEIHKNQQHDILTAPASESEPTEVFTASENTIEKQNSINIQAIITNIDTSTQGEKRKACNCDSYSVQIKKLKEENKKLRELQEEQNKKLGELQEEQNKKLRELQEEQNKKLRELQEEQNKKHVEELQKQKEVFKDIFKKEKEIIRKKLNAAHTKSKYLVRKTMRRDNKILKIKSALLNDLKNKGLIGKTTLNTLKQDFSDSILPIVQNESSNRELS